MSKIKNYGLDSLLTGTDKLIGSDSDSNGTTKNYSINSISDYIYTDLDIGRLANTSGTQYIYVQADGTDTENATALQTAYNNAKTMSPSATKRITVVAGIGNYNFGSSSFDMDTQYIDLVSLDGNKSVVFNSSNAGAGIFVSANDVFIKGIDTQTKPFRIGDNLNLLKIENCKGGGASFGGNNNVAPPDGFSGVNTSGTFTNCEGGGSSFGGGDNSFGGNASGTFTDCIGGGASFGGFGTASGTFTNCVGDGSSFGGGSSGTASGTFINCEGGSSSFGGEMGGIATGTFTNCIGGFASFGSDGTASGTFTNCVGGNSSFGSYSTASGTFTNCKAGDTSFGSFGGTASGTFTNCVGGDSVFADFGTASGTFTNCKGGSSSFGASGTLNGKLYYCRLTAGTFETPDLGGKIVLGIDGNDDIINLG